jgi:hypothetical protein
MRSEQRIRKGFEKEEVVRDEVRSGFNGGTHMCRRDFPESWIILPFDAPCSSVAHEAWHAVRRMLDYCGAEQENEVVAYHLGYVVNKIIHFLIKCEEEQEESKCHTQASQEITNVTSTAAKTSLQDDTGAKPTDNQVPAANPITTGFEPTTLSC